VKSESTLLISSHVASEWIADGTLRIRTVSALSIVTVKFHTIKPQLCSVLRVVRWAKVLPPQKVLGNLISPIAS
jgi:hypothetical protein